MTEESLKTEILEFAVECAKSAGKLIRTNFYARHYSSRTNVDGGVEGPKDTTFASNETISIEFKNDVDLVTQVDKRSEQLIMDMVKAKYPNHLFIGEEVCSKYKQ